MDVAVLTTMEDIVMKPSDNEDVRAAVEEVLRRSALDGAFRSLALSDGRAAIAKVTGRQPPVEFVITFVDNSGAKKTIPLPDLTPKVVEELTEEELEDVAGGSGGNQPPITGGWSKIGRVTF
jgi:hypothetical protein